MLLFAKARSFLRNLFSSKRVDTDLDREVQSHLEMLRDENRRAGLPEKEAERRARIELGGIEQVKEQVREQRLGNWIHSVLVDCRLVLRQFRKSPAFTAVAVLTLAIAVGANTVIFSLVNSVLLKPLSYPNPDRLIAVDHSSQELGLKKLGIAPWLYFVYREQNTTLEDIGAYDDDEADVTGTGAPEHLRVLNVTDGTLPLLNVRPVLGRLFNRKDDSPGATQTVVLTYPYWQQRFGGASSAIGRSIAVGGVTMEIIGVLPQTFHFLDERDPSLILPMQWDRAATTLGSFEGNAIARLKPSVSVQQATADLARLIPVAATTFPPPAGLNASYFQSDYTPKLIPLKEDVIGNVQNVLWILLASTILVLLVACANIANLLLVRVEGRHHEFAIRYAIGAARTGISANIVCESGLLGLAGSLIGLLLALGAMRAIVALGATNIPRIREVGVTPTVLVFTVAIALIASLLIACVPILKSTSPRLISDLREGGRGVGQSRKRQGTRKALVMLQVALSVILLICSGLMIRTFRAMTNVSPGFTSPETVQTFGFYIPDSQIPDASAELVIRMDEAIVHKIASIPGISSVSIGRSVPMDNNDSNNPVYVQNRSYEGSEVPAARRFNYVAPGFFSTLGTRLLAGRDFTWTDVYDKNLVVIVSKGFVSQYWSRSQDALGKRIRVLSSDPWREIIGVTEDVHYDGVERPSPSMVYWPLLMDNFAGHEQRLQRATVFVVRSPLANTQSLMNSIQQEVANVNPSVPLANSGTLGDLYTQSMARTTFTLVMLCVSGGIALLLGIVGIYGVIAYSVSQRSREMGIRMALGAGRRSISFMVLRQGALVMLIGIAVGLVTSLFIVQFIRALLYGIQPVDPATFVTVPVLLLAVGSLASYLPARRASRVDPMVALRYE